MRTLIACTALLLLPLSALAADAPNCRFSAPRSLSLDTTGISKVVVEVNQHTLKVAASGTGGKLDGRACASSEDVLKDLVLDQRRSGNTLLVSLRRDGKQGNWSVGSNYAWLDIRGSLPANLPLQFKVGSGDAEIDNAQSLYLAVGSGDAHARRVRGELVATVGSGDIDVDGAGSLDVASVGSGDLKARGIGGNVRIGTVGSGDVEVSNVRGNLRLETLGSGDVDFRDVSGNVDVGTVGSGEVKLGSIGGSVDVRSHSSGDIIVNGAGSLTVGHSGSGDVQHSGVRGAVNLPRRR